MLKKDSGLTQKDSIFKALVRASKLPELIQKEEGVLFQTVLKLSQRHEANL